MKDLVIWLFINRTEFIAGRSVASHAGVFMGSSFFVFGRSPSAGAHGSCFWAISTQSSSAHVEEREQRAYTRIPKPLSTGVGNGFWEGMKNELP